MSVQNNSNIPQQTTADAHDDEVPPQILPKSGKCPQVSELFFSIKKVPSIHFSNYSFQFATLTVTLAVPCFSEEPIDGGAVEVIVFDGNVDVVDVSGHHIDE